MRDAPLHIRPTPRPPWYRRWRDWLKRRGDSAARLPAGRLSPVTLGLLCTAGLVGLAWSLLHGLLGPLALLALGLVIFPLAYLAFRRAEPDARRLSAFIAAAMMTVAAATLSSLRLVDLDLGFLSLGSFAAGSDLPALAIAAVVTWLLRP